MGYASGGSHTSGGNTSMSFEPEYDATTAGIIVAVILGESGFALGRATDTREVFTINGIQSEYVSHLDRIRKSLARTVLAENTWHY
jgi:hypothetical protein